MTQDPRSLPRTTSLCVHGSQFPPLRMRALEGQESPGVVDLKPLMVGADMVLVEIFEQAGVRVPTHAHDDHESVVYLVSGRMQLVIGDEVFEARAGDTWRHPVGVPHSSVALEDCLAIEVKSPPRKTWNTAG